MSRRVVGFFSLLVIVLAAIGLMAFTFLGTATGVAGNATSKAFGANVSLDTALSSSNVIGPLPHVVSDKLSTSNEAALVRIADIPPGGALIQEIAALYVQSKVDLTKGTAFASSDTAHVGLLRTARVVPGKVPLLPAVPAVPAVPAIPAVPAVPGVGGAALPATTFYNRVDLDAVHGVVNLDCTTLAGLRTASEVERLNAITKGSQILRLQVPDLNVDLKLIDTLTDNLGSTTDDHAAGLHIRVALDTLGLPPLPVLGNRIAEIWLYEVKGTNLTSPSLTNATVSASVTMVHAKILDKTTGLLEADIKIGHAEASLSNCGASPTPTPTVTTTSTNTATPDPFIVDTTKVVESINGVVTSTQAGLTASPGQEVEYSLTVFNRSSGPSCAITRVEDTLPSGMTLVSNAGDFGNGTYNQSDGTIVWDNLSIPNGEARRHGIVVRFNNGAPAGRYVNRFTATGTCGTFTAFAPAVEIPVQVLGVKFGETTPGTGVADTALWALGALTLVAAAGGVTVLRRQ